MPGLANPKESLSRIEILILWWGNRAVSAITGATCREFAGTRTPSSARRLLEDLRAALWHYHREGFLENVPGIVLPPKEPPRERWLTRHEVARLLWTAWRAKEAQRGTATRRFTSRHVARFLLIALYTGTRAGAICSASWDQFDMDAGIFYRRPEGEAERANKRRPPVPIPPRLLPHLRRWKRRTNTRHPVEFRGEPVQRLSKGFDAIARKAGLPDVTPHVLRHTAATWLMQAGCDLWEAAGFLGMSVEVLRERYAHHHPDYLGNAAAAIGTKRATANTSTSLQAGSKRTIAERSLSKRA